MPSVWRRNCCFCFVLLQKHNLEVAGILSTFKVSSVEFKNMVDLVSRTGRHLQRYSKGSRVVVGCIPYRYKLLPNKTSFVDEDSLEVLVITAKRKCKGMLFPRGGWELDETMQEAARRETIEEAGVVGDLSVRLGKWKNQNKETYMYGLLVKEQLEFWPEQDKRQRIWMSVKEARKECKQEWMSGALEKLVKMVTTDNEANSGSGCYCPAELQQDTRRCNL